MSTFIQLLNRLCFYYVMIFKAIIYQFLNNDAQSSCPIGLKNSCVSSPCKNSFFCLQPQTLSLPCQSNWDLNRIVPMLLLHGREHALLFIVCLVMVTS